MKTENLTKLKINKLTQAQYNAALEANTIQSNELYMVTDSILDVSKGGTGATTVAGARNALGLGNTSGALPIANGGTGARTATEARINLGVEPTIHDSGWITATLDSKFISYNENTNPKYRKIGKLVELVGAVKAKSPIAGSSTRYTIFTLPEGYRPSIEMTFICQGSGINIWTLRVTKTGDVSLERYRNGSGYVEISKNTWLPFNAMFFVD